jgi:quercetin dioxygenase-like cupin family protein
MRRFVSLLPVVLAIVSLHAGPVLAEGAPEGHSVVNPDNLKWIDNPSLPGSKIAVLNGDPKKPGPYTLRLKIPPHAKNPPHSHPDNRQVTVLAGTWNFGHGDKFDPAKSTQLPAGTFFTEPAKGVHYNFTGNEEVLVQISGVGPTGTEFIKK